MFELCGRIFWINRIHVANFLIVFFTVLSTATIGFNVAVLAL